MQGEPQLVPAAHFPPGHCFFCAGVEGPLIDTMVDLVGDGRIYVCVRTCLPLYARLAGWAAPEMVDGLAAALRASEGLTEALQGELERERASKVVSVSDMLRLIERRDAAAIEGETDARRQLSGELRRATEAAALVGESVPTFKAEPPRPSTPSPPDNRCVAIKTNGERCKAGRLPGSQLCLFHVKQLERTGELERVGA